MGAEGYSVTDNFFAGARNFDRYTVSTGSIFIEIQRRILGLPPQSTSSVLQSQNIGEVFESFTQDILMSCVSPPTKKAPYGALFCSGGIVVLELKPNFSILLFSLRGMGGTKHRKRSWFVSIHQLKLYLQFYSHTASACTTHPIHVKPALTPFQGGMVLSQN